MCLLQRVKVADMYRNWIRVDWGGVGCGWKNWEESLQICDQASKTPLWGWYCLLFLFAFLQKCTRSESSTNFGQCSFFNGFYVSTRVSKVNSKSQQGCGYTTLARPAFDQQSVFGLPQPICTTGYLSSTQLKSWSKTGRAKVHSAIEIW